MDSNQLMNEPLPPGITRRELLDMACNARLRATHPGMAPELIAFAVMVSHFERDRCQALCRSMSFEFSTDSGERDALQRAATRMEMQEYEPNAKMTGA